MEKEEKILLSSIVDKADKCYLKNVPTYTNFLDLHQQTLLSQNLKSLKVKPVLYGGYDEAERKIAVFLPDYMTDEEIDEIAVLRAKVNGREELCHRDYLGAVLGTGVKREQIGDIIVKSGEADILAKKEMCEFLCNNLIKAGRANLSCEILSLSEVEFKKAEPKEIRMVSASSLRLDKITAEGFKISRTDASANIEAGRVFVNQREVLKPDFQLDEGDKITLRGKGKIELCGLNGISRKGKIRIELKIY